MSITPTRANWAPIWAMLPGKAPADPYGTPIAVNGAFLKAHHDTVAAFVKVTQKAFAACASRMC